MSAAGWLQWLLLGVLIAISTPLLAKYMYRVYFTDKAPGDRFFKPVENFIYRICGVDPDGEQRWRSYAMSLLAFSFVSVLFTYALLRLQAHLPFNPDHQIAVSPALSFNTAVSFLTNTNWQAYAGESTMSHLSQMLAWCCTSTSRPPWAWRWRSPSPGPSSGAGSGRWATSGSTWSAPPPGSCCRSRFVFAIVFMSQGVIQNFHASRTVTTVAAQGLDGKGNVISTQTIPGGPVASMEPIEDLGDNGGGFFNGNTAAPLRGPQHAHRPAGDVAGDHDPLRLPVHVRQSGRVDGNRVRWCSPPWPSSSSWRPASSIRWRHGQPQAHPGRRQSIGDGQQSRREHGGQGAALRHRRLDHERHGRHGHLGRRHRLGA